jgi:hypothetical protein
VFADLAWHDCRVQMEQSDMPLALNMAKIVNRGILCATIEKTQYLIKKLQADVGQDKKRAVEIPGYKQVMASIERPSAMLC